MAFVTDEDIDETTTPGMNVIQDAIAPEDTPIQQDQPSLITPGLTATQAPKLKKTKEGSGQFTDIRRYIEANRPKSKQMAESVVGGVEKRATDIRKGLEKGEQQFKQRIAPEQQRLAGGEQFVSQALVDPTAFVKNAQELERFKQFREGGGLYKQLTGPDLSALRARTGALEDLSRNIGGPVGRAALLRETLGTPEYTRGQQSLDQLLLQGDIPSRQLLETGVRGATEGLRKEVGGTQRRALQDIQALREQATGVRKGVQTKLFGVEGEEGTGEFAKLKATIGERAKQYNIGKEELTQSILQGLQSGQIEKEDIEKLNERGKNFLEGLSTQRRLPEVDPSQFLKVRNLLGVETEEGRQFRPEDYVRAATEEQFAKQRALETLADTGETFLPGAFEDVRDRVTPGLYTGKDIGLRGLETERGRVQRTIDEQYERDLLAAAQQQQIMLGAPEERHAFLRGTKGTPEEFMRELVSKYYAGAAEGGELVDPYHRQATTEGLGDLVARREAIEEMRRGRLGGGFQVV